MRFLPGNAQHIGARHSQQDSFGFADLDDTSFIQHGGFLAIVCDGMGGMEHGDLAGRTAVRAFLDAYARKTPQESVPVALDRSAREANARVVALAHSLGRAEGVGTTLVAATLLDGAPGQARLYWVSVGDSGLFLVSGGQMRMVNRPHVFANHLDQAVARGTLSLEAAMTHPERDSLTSYIGAEVLEEIDLTPEPLMLADGDTILLASDGMFKTLSPAEITVCLAGHPQGWPERLVQETLARHKESQDNVTVLSVTVEGEPVTVSAVSGSFVRPPEFADALRAHLAQQTAPTVRIPAQETPPVAPPLAAPVTPAPVSPPAAFAPPAAPNLAATDMIHPAWPQPGIPPGGPSVPKVPEKTGSRTWILVAAVILLLCVGGGGWWYWTHRAALGSHGMQPKDAPATDQPSPAAPPHDPSLPAPQPDPNAPAPGAGANQPGGVK